MFERVTLEMSIKPFKQTDEPYIRRVCAEAFDRWRALLHGRKTIAVMLWTSDGSEILDYTGDPDAEFEWCYFLGTANLPLITDADDPASSLHQRKHLYIEDPPKMTYRILKTIVTCLKEEGKRAFPDATILVGETFDIGPEFAISDFKYNRHTEIIGSKSSGHEGSSVDSFGMVDSTALLKGDDHPYAAYPNGIPDGTPFGTFLGAQTRCFLPDMGFDYLWLSNGLGFSADPWKTTGKIFDGKAFHPEKLEQTRKKVFDFWRHFREACPDIPIETRGTNNSAGIDYASDGVPLYDIYRSDFGILPPPNSPWAAINDNFGLEIMGHMTRIAELPGADFMFRYYVHDPWWVNSPWYDRYDGAPSDIYLPMAISRLDENGVTRTAAYLNLLSIDNSFGDLPPSCANEPIPHLLKAEKNAADAPAPIVWVYPVREYTSANDEQTLAQMHGGDTFIMDAINAGFPLNCVVSTDNFLRHDPALYRESILLSPVPETEQIAERLLAMAAEGQKVLLYGTSRKLKTLPPLPHGVRTIDIADAPEVLLDALAACGIHITHVKKVADAKVPTMTVARSDNGYFFSAYNSNTTTETHLKFPLGAPILHGCETELKDGASTYRFGRCEHRECRIFVQQKDGVISAHEIAPVNRFYRRRFLITGLRDATVCYFPEAYCATQASVGCVKKDIGSDMNYSIDPDWKSVVDEKNGTYYKKEHVTGDFYFYMPFPDKITKK